MNPFAARWLTPGAVAYRGADVGALVDRLDQRRAWQIVGGHGTGKSTLVASLWRELARRGSAAELTTFRDGARRRTQHTLPGRAPTVVIVDGYEQVHRWMRWRWRLRSPLVVTCHASLGLPTLWRTVVTPEIAESVAAELLQRTPDSAVPPSAARTALRTTRGDLREALFLLYDAHQSARPLQVRDL